MVEWRISTPRDIESVVVDGMIEPTGIGQEQAKLLGAIGIERSLECRTYFVNGVMVCVVGIVAESIIADECHVWAAFVPAAKSVPKTIARHTRAYIHNLPYHRVTCLCDPRFETTIGWVKWMGFTLVGKHVIMGNEYDLFERRA